MMKKIFNKTKFVVLGDFNVEPYDSAILEGLRSTRDQKVISNNSSLFYNPFGNFYKLRKINPQVPITVLKMSSITGTFMIKS